MMLLDLENLITLLTLILFTYFSWRKIELGIMAIVFCLPLYLIRLNIFGIPSTTLELLIYVLFFIWLAKNYCADTPPNLSYEGRDKNAFLPLIGGAIGGIIRQKFNLIKKEKTLTAGILLLMSGAAISTIFSSDIRTSAGILKGWFVDPLLFFIVLVSVIKNSNQAENVLKVFSLSGFAVAAVSLLYWFGLLPNGISYDSRLHGVYASPNYLAMYLAAPFIIAVWLFFLSLRAFRPAGEKRGNPVVSAKFSGLSACGGSAEGITLSSTDGFATTINKHFWLIVVLIIVAAIYLTYSYAAWLAIAVSVFLLIYFIAGTEKKLSFYWKLSFLGVFLVLVVLFFSQAGTGKFENLKNLSYRSSANSRIMIWRSAWEIGKDNWLIGIGPGNFQKYYLDYQKRFTEPYLEWAVPEPHNIFLAFWLETGILGLAGFVLILVWFFRSSILILKEPRMDGVCNIAIILLSVMAYILLHGLFDTTYWKNDLAMIFWLFLGLMAVIKKTAK